MVTIHRKKMCMTIVLGVKFLPGMNTISDAEMALIEKHPGFMSEIECGNMIMGKHIDTPTSGAVDSGGDIKARAGKLVEEISGMRVTDAKEVISEMGDGYLLRAIAEKDGRKGIQDAVSDRMKSISAQEGSDLTPESKSAPEGDGSNFAGDISGKKQDVDGAKGHTAIPALNK